MNEGVRSALFRMGQAIARDMAVHYARLAYEAGASPALLDQAWAEWDAQQAELVQVIDPDAAPPGRCRCSHPALTHTARTGRCHSLACGCRTYRPKGDEAA